MKTIDFIITLHLEKYCWETGENKGLKEHLRNEIYEIYNNLQAKFGKTYIKTIVTESDKRAMVIDFVDTDINFFIENIPVFLEQFLDKGAQIEIMPCTSESDLFYKNYLKTLYVQYSGRIPYSNIKNSEFSASAEAFENYFYPKLRTKLNEKSISVILENSLIKVFK